MNKRVCKITEREKHLQRRVTELSTLYEISKLLTSTLELNEVLDLIVEKTARMVGVKACGLRLLDQNTGEMVLKAAYGLTQNYIQKGRVFSMSGVYRDVISKGQVAIVYDIARDARVEYPEEAVEEGIKSMLSVGLLIRGMPIGALSVYTEHYHHFTRGQIQIFKGIANEAAAVIEKAMLYEARKQSLRVEQELAAAAKIQANLMPQEIPQPPGFRIAAKNIPSRMIGGDFYDFINFGDYHLGITIADVSGKGIPGALLMASTRATLRADLANPHTVKGVITKLNHVLCRDTESDQFVTLFYGMLDIKDKTFTYTNAGHNPPILFRRNEKILLQKGGLILGILPDAVYEEKEIQLSKGDILLLYTDGITEAQRNDEYFGVEKLSKLIQNNKSKSPEEIADLVFAEAAEFSTNPVQDDDRTIVLISYTGF